jgi:hypothetical protein
MSDYGIVNADDVADAYAGTDVPGEFRVRELIAREREAALADQRGGQLALL